MALTGLQIQKLLPKTNCKECGSNTCLAFAMKLAAKKASLSDCPDASDEAKEVLGAASEPPVKKIELGFKRSLKLGDETVLYRHEKTFVNQTAIAININDTDSAEQIENILNKIKDYLLERVGEELKIDMVSVTQKSDSPETFANIAGKVAEITNLLQLNKNNLSNLFFFIFSSNHLFSTHILPQNFWNLYASIFLLMIFHNCNQYTRSCKHSIIQGMSKISFAFILNFYIQSPCLRIS